MELPLVSSILFLLFNSFEIIAIESAPLNRIIEMAPAPCGVANATIVSFIFISLKNKSKSIRLK